MKSYLLCSCFVIFLLFSAGAKSIPDFFRKKVTWLFVRCHEGHAPSESCYSDDSDFDLLDVQFKSDLLNCAKYADLPDTISDSKKSDIINYGGKLLAESFSFEKHEFNITSEELSLDPPVNSDVDQLRDETGLVRCIHFMMQDGTKLAAMFDRANDIKVRWERISEGENNKSPNMCTHIVNEVACCCRKKK